MRDIEIELLTSGFGHRLSDVAADVFDNAVRPEDDNVAALTLYERTGGRRLVPDPVLFEFTLDRRR